MSNNSSKKQHPMAVHLVAGGAAGLVESSICHPFDTIKTRLQLQQSSLRVAVESAPAAAQSLVIASNTNTSASEVSAANRRAFSSVTTQTGLLSNRPAIQPTTSAVGMARSIVVHEGVPSLYKGLTAVWSAVVPKMSIRFVSFEWYRGWLGSIYHKYSAQDQLSPSSISSSLPSSPPPSGQQQYPRSVNFVAGLASGLTEAILVVTPAEVCKIRMQSQKLHPLESGRSKYTNAAQTATVIVREEGLGALWRGVVPTMLRQGCNQACNFTAYNAIKDSIVQYRRENGVNGGKADAFSLEPHESLILGGLSGGLGPIVNNPLGKLSCGQVAMRLL